MGEGNNSKQFDDPSYTISPVPSAQALAVTDQKSSLDLGDSLV